MNHDAAVRRLPSRLLLDPQYPDVWGLYETPEESWLATYRLPVATHLYLPGFASFWVLPTLSAYALATLEKAGVARADAPLAMFAGLVGDVLTGHRDNEAQLAYGWQQIQAAYQQAVSGNWYGFARVAIDAKKPRAPVMALDTRALHLLPSPSSFHIAMARLRAAYDAGGSVAAALADIRDTLAAGVSSAVYDRFSRLVLDHEANELLASEALAVDSPALSTWAASQGLNVQEARASLLHAAGAPIMPTTTITRPNVAIAPGRPAPNNLSALRPRAPSSPAKPTLNLSALQTIAPGILNGARAPARPASKATGGGFFVTADDAPAHSLPGPYLGPVWVPLLALTGAGAVGGALYASDHRVVGGMVGAAAGVAASVAAAVVLGRSAPSAPDESA